MLSAVPVMGQGFDVLAALSLSVLRKQRKLAVPLLKSLNQKSIQVEISPTAIVLFVA